MKKKPQARIRKYRWVPQRIQTFLLHRAARKTDKVLQEENLHCICDHAGCPNRIGCHARKQITFLILGTHCTRHCRFCAMERGTPSPVDPTEPERLANGVTRLKMDYVIITSVTRDDLPDGGAAHFADVVRAVVRKNPEIKVEILVPDFKGKETALRKALSCPVFVFNHNLETVERLYPRVRPDANYRRSLNVLKSAKEIKPELIIKSGIMVGLGETDVEILQLMDDLRAVGCQILTIGQYGKSREDNLDAARLVTDDEFARLESCAREKGFIHVSSRKLVQTSHQEETICDPHF